MTGPRILAIMGSGETAPTMAKVHRALFEVRVRLERVRLAQHGVDERGLAVIDVGDDRDVAQVVSSGHGHG